MVTGHNTLTITTKLYRHIMKRLTWLDKERLYHIIFLADTPAGKTYDVLLIIGILASIITAFVESMPSLAHPFQVALEVLEYFFAVIFTFDYVARLYCSPSRREYALSFFGIIDLISTAPPYLAFIFPGARYMLLLRSIRFIRVFRVFRLFSFLNEGYLLLESLRRSINKILVYFLFVLILVTCIGTLMYIVEGNAPHTQFTDLGTSVYYAIVTMTTVGFGDVTPVTPTGKFLSSMVMLLGYTIIAIPTGIVTATFVNETSKPVQHGCCPRCGQKVRKNDRFCSQCGEKLA